MAYCYVLIMIFYLIRDIFFNESGRIIISKKVSERISELFNISNDINIELSEEE